MSTPAPTYRDPLADLAPSLPPITDDRQPDGKSLVNPARPDNALSPWYSSYPVELDQGNNAFDFHVYYDGEVQMVHARKLHERIRREFPELRAYRFWEVPVGPHPKPMFEVNTFTPAQFGALFGFLVAFRGDLSVLIHPNTFESELLDHTTKATWMGERLELILEPLRAHEGRFSSASATAQGGA